MVAPRALVLSLASLALVACRAPATTDAPDARVAPVVTAVARAPDAAAPRAFHARSLDRDLPDDEAEAARIRLGARIFGDTPRYAPAYVGCDVSCRNCHLEAGQKLGALPLVGAEAIYPTYQKRPDRLMSIEERIQGCFERSESGAAPPIGSDVLDAVTAYVRWLSADAPRGADPPWRGKNKIDEAKRIPIAQLRVDDGERVFVARCASCHGLDGRGLVPDGGAGDAPIPPPLWGPRSFNDGAGVARVYTLAGFIRHAMPLGAGGTVGDVDAQNLAAYIDSKDRPSFARKLDDYPDGGPPVDAVYYPNLYAKNPLKR